MQHGDQRGLSNPAAGIGAVFLLGVGVGFIGLVDDDMYVLGALIIFVAVVGVVVRIVEAVHRRVSAGGEIMDV